MFADFSDKIYDNFIKDDRWQYLTKGLGTTLLITLFAIIIGIILGFIIATIRSSTDKLSESSQARRSIGFYILKFFNWLCKVYLTVIRGTPVAVQLMIIYFVIFQSMDIDKVFVAVIAFGLNSAAYVAEIVRSGIMSIDRGQTEAGRSLGLSYVQTTIYIIMPQAFKNILPALANEFIVLLKETSVAGFIGLMDLTKGGDIIRSLTYEAFLPLIAIALIYLILVMILTKLVSILERRLRNSDH
ncbi:MAG: amino acid ABC transporter permease [Clostridia bacterium]